MLWDLNGATLELAPLEGMPQLDSDVRRLLPQVGGRYAVNGILTGWAYGQVSEIGLAVPNCHVWGQFACEHWDWETQTRRELVPPSSGLSTAHEKLHGVVKDLRLDTECIYAKSHSLAFRFPVDTDEKVVERLAFKPSVVMDVGDAPDRVIMDELDRMRREDGIPTFKVGVRNLREGVDLFLPSPPRGVLPFMRALRDAPVR
ncbi:hypothetical protein ACQEU6_31120 [Spirillospora sp. CA-108201]